MKLCFIADANSIHTRRWIAPLCHEKNELHLLSYKAVTESAYQYFDKINIVDLTRLTNLRKIRFAYWGLWARRYVSRLKPHVLHAHQIQAAGWIAAFSNYHPLVVSAWGSDILVEPRKSLFRRGLVSHALRRCDQLTVPSQHMLNAAQELGVPDNKLSLIPWGIETNIFNRELDDRAMTRDEFNIGVNTHVIFCPRGMSPIYNHDILLHAVKELADDTQDLCVVFLNYGVDEGYLKLLHAQTEAEGLTDLVRWLPAQSTPQKMARLYRMADVVVSLPSSDGYGFTVYEAMACGCPTLITDLAVFQQELTHGVHTMKVAPRNRGQTANTLRQLMEDIGLRDTLAANTAEISQNKSVSMRIDQTNNLYRMLSR